MDRYLAFFKWPFYVLIAGIVILIGTIVVVRLTTEASNNRDWNDDQKLLPYALIEDNLITIHNIRNFKYASTTSYTESYYSKSFDLNKIKKVWYVVEPFSGIPGSAHTFLSFEFEGDEFVSISIEIRKEKGEVYSPITGLFNAYEIMYVIADERDAIKLRSNYRKDLVYVYPGKATVEKTRALFVDMVKRANQLREKPEFYNSITNTCTTNIVNHINEVTPDRLPLINLGVLFPANSDKLAYESGLIDTDLSFEEMRKKFFINERAEKYADDPNFSMKIRE